MKKIYLFIMVVVVAFSVSACKKVSETSPKTTNTPSATEQVTMTPSETPAEVITQEPTEIPTAEPVEDNVIYTDIPTDRPNVIQKEGWISLSEAESLLRTFLGSFDSNGNEFIFGYEDTINKDGRDYYNFRITTLILDESGTAHQSYYANYIVSTDGIDVEEY